MPQAAAIGALGKPNYPPATSRPKGAEEAARTIGMGTVALRASTDGEIETAFETAITQRIRVLAAGDGDILSRKRNKCHHSPRNKSPRIETIGRKPSRRARLSGQHFWGKGSDYPTCHVILYGKQVGQFSIEAIRPYSDYFDKVLPVEMFRIDPS